MWLILAGRGWGKTRTGAEWLRAQAEQNAGCRLAIVGETLHDARAVMVEGESGLLAIAPPWAKPTFEISKRQVRWPNNSLATLYSADDPEQLRGPQFHAAWCDEVAKWHYPMTWDNLMMAVRLGASPQIIATTTPKPVNLIERIMALPSCHVTGGSTFDNTANLPDAFLEQLHATYANTSLGQQELMGRLLKDMEGALWAHAGLERCRAPQAPALQRIVVSIDPAVTSHAHSDETGIIVAGLGQDNKVYILHDASGVYPPTQLASTVAATYHHWQADRIIAEVNNGGDLVASLLRVYDASLPITPVRASVGKRARAEPVAALYEQGQVHHVGLFATLEKQMVSYTGRAGEASPDRLDALVWAVHALRLNQATLPRVRSL